MANAAALERPHAAGGGRHVADRPQMLAVGVMIWLGSEFMFFSGLFAAFFTIRAAAPHWPIGSPIDTFAATRSFFFSIVLLSSSVTVQKGVWAQEKNQFRAAKVWIVASFVLGLAFVLNQAYEWWSLPFYPHTNAYTSLFFIMSGLHGLHVILGLVAMLALLGRLGGSKNDPGETAVFQAVSYYWHFVDFMWIGLYSCLFLLSGAHIF
ncbi:MAG TPA: cytochrome c oxidase subunit 3 [Acidimicrobiales bacterium]|nr:cytochrome c oxidase subunit 3 [Acidimicrobiales bacterium]